jgi:hypothetical protein
MEVTGILSLVWFVGSIVACVAGCHRFRDLGKKIKVLEEKLEKSQQPLPSYNIPMYPPTASAPYAGFYETVPPVRY